MADELSIDELFGPAPTVAPAQTDTPPPPTPVIPVGRGPLPKAFVQRFNQGATPLNTILSEAGKGIKEGYGDISLGSSDPTHSGQLGWSPESIKWLQDNVIPAAGPLRWLAEGVAKPVTQLVAFGDLIARTPNALIHGLAKGAGGVSEATGIGNPQGVEQTVGELLEIELIRQMGDAGQTITRPQINTMGKLEDTPIGRIPQPEDFGKTATVLGDKAAESTIKDLWNDHGIMPAEVAHDATRDVTITQDILTNQPAKAFKIEAPKEEGRIIAADEDGVNIVVNPPEDIAVESTAGKELIDNRKDVATTGSGGSGEPPAGEGGAGTVGGPEAPKALPSPSEPMSVDAAKDSLLSQISVGKHDYKRPLTFARFYSALFDDLNPVKVAVKKAVNKLGLGKLETSQNPYDLFRLTKGTYGKADQMLTNGTFDFHTYADNGQSLQSILKPVEGSLNEFRAYTAGKRAIELDKRGIDSGFDLNAAETYTKANPKFEATHRALVDYQNRVSKYLKDSGVVSEKGYQAMLKANEEYVPFYRLLDRENMGLMAKEASKKLSAKNPLKKIKGGDQQVIDPLESVIKNTYAYIALAEKNAAGVKLVELLQNADNGHVFERSLLENPEYGKTGHNGGPALEGPTGTKELPAPALEGEIIPPNSVKTIEEVKREDVIDADFEEIAKEFGIKDKDLIATITNASHEQVGDTINVFIDGKKHSYKTSDADLLAAWKGLDSQTASMITKILSKPASWLRLGATVTPEFVVKNLIRDTLSAFINVHGAVFSPINTAKGLKGILTKDQDFQNWLKGGGANSAMVSLDRRYIQEKIFQLHAETGLGTKVWNTVSSPVAGLRMLSELAENSTRLGIFKAKAGFGKAATKAEIQAAALESREGTLDFARAGSQVRAYNMITAFFNASLQGSDRLVRAFKEHPVETGLKVAIGVTIPSVLLWAHNHDDPRWKEIPHWQKDMFWIFMTDKHIFRVPKPFETGILFGSGPERMLDAYYDQNPDAFKGFASSIGENLMPSLIPTAALPPFEQIANKSMFTGQPIVPTRLEKQLPEYQYSEYTSESAKMLGRLFSALPGIRNAAQNDSSLMNGIATAVSSPALIENYVRDWTGGLGQYALQIADFDLKKAGLVPDVPKPLATLADIPFVKSFVIRYPSASAQSIQDFYDKNAQNATVMNTLNTRAKEGDLAAVQKISALYQPRVVLDGIQKTLGEQSALVRMIYKNPNFTPNDKRQMIDNLYYMMMQESQQGNKMLDAVEKALNQTNKVE